MIENEFGVKKKDIKLPMLLDSNMESKANIFSEKY